MNITVENKRLIKKIKVMSNLELLKIQLSVQEGQVTTLKRYQNGEISFSETVRSIISLQEQTEEGAGEYFCEWIVQQLKGNPLPNNSSGSFMTALGCIDHLMENEMFEDIDSDKILQTALGYNLS
ncbi:hypothetical protein N9E82_00760 [bacterium]|nr:hypothetical protein [bacterium]